MCEKWNVKREREEKREEERQIETKQREILHILRETTERDREIERERRKDGIEREIPKPKRNGQRRREENEPVTSEDR